MCGSLRRFKKHSLSTSGYISFHHSTTYHTKCFLPYRLNSMTTVIQFTLQYVAQVRECTRNVGPIAFLGLVCTQKRYTRSDTTCSFDVLLTVLHLSTFISVINQMMHKICFTISFISCLYMFRALCAHHQEVKIALHFIISSLYATTCFEHYVLIIRRSKLYYTL